MPSGETQSSAGGRREEEPESPQDREGTQREPELPLEGRGVQSSMRQRCKCSTREHRTSWLTESSETQQTPRITDNVGKKYLVHKNDNICIWRKTLSKVHRNRVCIKEGNDNVTAKGTGSLE